MTILDEIVVEKKKHVAAHKALTSLSQLEQLSAYGRTCYSLVDSLANPDRSNIITEFKRKSPSKGLINSDADVVNVTKGYAANGSACLSVLTDTPFFGGKDADLQAARINEIPILRKDFMIDTYQVFEAKALGADVILLIAACLSKQQIIELTDCAHSLGMEVLLELYGSDEIAKVYAEADLIGVNNRDLKTFKVDIDNSIRMLKDLPTGKPFIAESGIQKPETVIQLEHAGFGGFLMGERFMATSDPAKAFGEYYQTLKSLQNEA